PLPPDPPSYIAPVNGSPGQPTTVKLEWEGGPWSHKYDIFFGTNSNPPLLLANVSTVQSGAVTGQPLLDTGSVDDGVKETLTLPITLQAGTTYFWKVVGKTMANKTAAGPVWSFTTSGSPPPPTPTPTPTPTPIPTPTPTPPPTPSAASIQLSNNSFSVNEGGLSATVTVTR